MRTSSKPIESLCVEDLRAFPVWEFTGWEGEGEDETFVRPVTRLPVSSMAGKVIGTEVTFGNGMKAWALISNVDADDARQTQHFLTLKIEKDGVWFRLARYFDVDADTSGPQALSNDLGLAVDEVFPIKYDLRQFVTGDVNALEGFVPAEPIERLTHADLMALIFAR